MYEWSHTFTSTLSCYGVNCEVPVCIPRRNYFFLVVENSAGSVAVADEPLCDSVQ